MIASMPGVHRTRLHQFFHSDKWFRRLSLHPLVVSVAHLDIGYLHIGPSMSCRMFEVAGGFGVVADARPGEFRFRHRFAVRPARWVPQLMWVFEYPDFIDANCVSTASWTGRTSRRFIGYAWRGWVHVSNPPP